MPDTTTQLSYELGITRFFGECDLGVQGLLSGWAVPEEAHVWNDGPEATMMIKIPEPRSACRLTFEGEPFLQASCVQQDITLYVNGFRVGFWQLNTLKTYSFSVDLQPEHLFERKGGVIAQCVWHLPRSAKPSDLGLSDDGRQLGFCFRSFTISAIAETY